MKKKSKGAAEAKSAYGANGTMSLEETVESIADDVDKIAEAIRLLTGICPISDSFQEELAARFGPGARAYARPHARRKP